MCLRELRCTHWPWASRCYIRAVDLITNRQRGRGRADRSAVCPPAVIGLAALVHSLGLGGQPAQLLKVGSPSVALAAVQFLWLWSDLGPLWVARLEGLSTMQRGAEALASLCALNHCLTELHGALGAASVPT